MLSIKPMGPAFRRTPCILYIVPLASKFIHYGCGGGGHYIRYIILKSIGALKLYFISIKLKCNCFIC